MSGNGSERAASPRTERERYLVHAVLLDAKLPSESFGIIWKTKSRRQRVSLRARIITTSPAAPIGFRTEVRSCDGADRRGRSLISSCRSGRGEDGGPSTCDGMKAGCREPGNADVIDAATSSVKVLVPGRSRTNTCWDKREQAAPEQHRSGSGQQLSRFSEGRFPFRLWMKEFLAPTSRFHQRKLFSTKQLFPELNISLTIKKLKKEKNYFKPGWTLKTHFVDICPSVAL